MERTNPFPTKFVDIVRINGNAVRKGKVAPSQSLRDSSPKGRALGNSPGEYTVFQNILSRAVLSNRLYKTGWPVRNRWRSQTAATGE